MCQTNMIGERVFSAEKKHNPADKHVDITCHVSGIILLSENGKVEKVNSNSLFEEQNVL